MNWKMFGAAIGTLALLTGPGCTIKPSQDVQQIFDGSKNETAEDEKAKRSP